MKQYYNISKNSLSITKYIYDKLRLIKLDYFKRTIVVFFFALININILSSSEMVLCMIIILGDVCFPKNFDQKNKEKQRILVYSLLKSLSNL